MIPRDAVCAPRNIVPISYKASKRLWVMLLPMSISSLRYLVALSNSYYAQSGTIAHIMRILFEACRRFSLCALISLAFLFIAACSSPLTHYSSQGNPSSIYSSSQDHRLDKRMISLTAPQTWTHTIGDWSLRLLTFSFAGPDALHDLQSLYNGVTDVTAPPFSNHGQPLRTFSFALGRILLILLSSDDRPIPDEMIYRFAMWLQHRAAAGFVGFCSGGMVSTTGQVIKFKLGVRQGALQPVNPNFGG